MKIKKYNQLLLLGVLVTIVFALAIWIYMYMYGNMSTIEPLNFDILDEAIKKRHQITPDYSRKVYMYNGNEYSFSRHFNNEESRILANKKDELSQRLQEHGIKVPSFHKWDFTKTRAENEQAIQKVIGGPPYVVKPTNASLGRHVYLNLPNLDTVYQKICHILNTSKYRDIVVEKHITGESYRVLMVNHQIVDIIRLDKPTVIGTGRHTLQELIQQYNQEQNRRGIRPIKTIDMDYIRTQGLPKCRKSTVIPAGKRIVLSLIGNPRNGCRAVRIPVSQVHPDNITLFNRVYDICGLTINGLDYSIEDISRSYKEQPIYVFEANPGPGNAVHMLGFPPTETQSFINTLADAVASIIHQKASNQ